MNENPTRTPAEARRRGLLLIWGAQLFSLVILFALTYVVRPESARDGNHTLAWALGVVGFMTFLLSFLVKRKLLTQAVAERRPDLGTTAHVIAFAMCEMTALLGFAAYLITGLPYTLHSFIIAAGGLLLHFPSRGALEGIETNGTGANFKTTL